MGREIDKGGLCASARVLDLGVAVLEVKRFHPVTAQREPCRAGTEHEDVVHLIVPLHGTVNATWSGLQDTVTVDDLYVHDLTGWRR
ncbi:hypothetical protein [Nonomuraea sp. NPDC049400]|uniref:hypothetical protein n=1 Tax=Nonomuraea sp. NPDC049400 TaxID=3364352 RepID=UPI0037AD63FA